MKKLTDEELLAIVNYNPGGCLCGHFETCSVCSRSSETRQLELNAKFAAFELLEARGVKLRDTQKRGYANIPYSTFSIEES
jgi:hypothetical protein